MEELRRTKAGPFREDETLVTLHQLKDAYEIWRETGDEKELRRVIHACRDCAKAPAQAGHSR